MSALLRRNSPAPSDRTSSVAAPEKPVAQEAQLPGPRVENAKGAIGDAAVDTPFLSGLGLGGGNDLATSMLAADTTSMASDSWLSFFATGAGADTEKAPAIEEPTGVVLTQRMKPGTRGPDVSALQTHLGIESTGRYDDATRAAVQKWQTENGLDPDGIVGSATLDALAKGAKGVQIDRTIRTGSRGSDVERLQRFLGLPVDGKFGGDTRTALVQFQMDHGLDPDGVVGQKTRDALAAIDMKEAEGGAKNDTAVAKDANASAKNEADAGADGAAKDGATEKRDNPHPPGYGPKGELRSRWHDPTKFVPKYASTAYSESGIYRGKNDPYAVGTISRPSRSQDLGGKTYGVYQFESSVYRDGSSRGKKAVDGSTVMRFARWEGNPYGKQMLDVVKKHGVASKQFDDMWKDLAHGQNKAFGEAQQAFMEKENNDRVSGFMNTIGASEEARKDPRLQDLVIGTYNQYSGLTKAIGKHVAGRNGKGKLSAEEIGKLIQDYKRARVKSHFRSSPRAHKGIYSRIARERAMFE